MNAIFTAAKQVADFMKARHWEFCVIGGLAVQRWGELRATLDADLTLFRYVLRQLKPLCELKEAPELLEHARRILEKHPWHE